jgi:hypothetical protein
MAMLTDEEKVFKLVALFWTQFIKGADMEVADDCFDEAINKGALTNIRKNVKDLYDIPKGEHFLKAMDCCFKAGEKARELAENDTSDRIRPGHYADAYDDTSIKMARAIRMKTQDGVAEITAKICA